MLSCRFSIILVSIFDEKCICLGIDWMSISSWANSFYSFFGVYCNPELLLCGLSRLMSADWIICLINEVCNEGSWNYDWNCDFWSSSTVLSLISFIISGTFLWSDSIFLSSDCLRYSFSLISILEWLPSALPSLFVVFLLFDLSLLPNWLRSM